MTEKGPVVLIGIDQEGGGLAVVGLYDSPEVAQMAVQRGHVPSGAYYSVMTPPMNGYMVPKPMTAPPHKQE